MAPLVWTTYLSKKVHGYMNAQLKLQPSETISKPKKHMNEKFSYTGPCLKQHEAYCGPSKEERSLQLAQSSSD